MFLVWWLLVSSAPIARITFLHPRSAIVLNAYGGVEVPVETRIPSDPRSRLWSLEWRGDNCQGLDQRELHGEASPAVQPEMFGEKKLYTIRVWDVGVCTLSAVVLDGAGAVLARGTFEITVK